jgi:hypothetical protein
MSEIDQNTTENAQQETINVDGKDYVIADLPQEIQIKIRQYVICQQRIKEKVDAFNVVYNEFMTEKSILDAASHQYSVEVTADIKKVDEAAVEKTVEKTE